MFSIAAARRGAASKLGAQNNIVVLTQDPSDTGAVVHRGALTLMFISAAALEGSAAAAASDAMRSALRRASCSRATASCNH